MSLTVSRLPQVFQELAEMARTDPQGAAGEIRRRTRCAPQSAREIVRLLEQPDELVRKFPDPVALLLGEPQPSLLERFDARRAELLRLVRRGRRLDALQLLRSDARVTLFEAREFCEALRSYGTLWEQIAEDYAFPGKDFWNRPSPEPPPPTESGLLIPPEEFDPILFFEWIRAGQHRAAVLWVRRLAGVSRERCQAFVDRAEELLFEGAAQPWTVLSAEMPGVVAGLAALPDPNWLMELAPRRGELLELLASNRNMAATELVVRQFGCSSIEARRFLRSLQEGAKWDSTLERFQNGFAWPEKPAPAAIVSAPAPSLLLASVLPTPAPVIEDGSSFSLETALLAAGEPDTEHTEFFGHCPVEDGVGSAVHAPDRLPWDSAADARATASSPTSSGFEAKKMPWDSAADARATASGPTSSGFEAKKMPWDSAADSRATASSPTSSGFEAKKMPWDSAADARATASSPTSSGSESTKMPWDSAADARATASTPGNAVHDPARPPWQEGGAAYTTSTSLDLNDADALFGKLVDLSDALKRENFGEAREHLAELEAAGFNSRWVSDRYPPLKMMLPKEPWSQHIEQLGPVVETLHGVLDGSVDPKKLARDLAEKTLKAAHLDNIVQALERAWKSKSKADMKIALGMIKEHPDLEKEVNARVPWLADLMDLDHDGTADILELSNDPGAYFLELVQQNHPELVQRLGDARLKKIREALPELMEALRERNMRDVMRTMMRLRLGPSDVKALLAVIKSLLSHKPHR